MRTLELSVPLLVAALLSPRGAHAQEAAAEALFDSAREAMAKGDLVHACERFRESGRLDSAVGTDLNLADCEEKRGRFATAWQLFRAVEEKLAPGDERIAVAHERARALESRVPKVTLRLGASAPEASTVRDGRVELGHASFGVALPMDPGPHDLVVSAPGRKPSRYRIELGEGEVRAVDVTPGGVSGSARPTLGAPSPGPRAASSPLPAPLGTGTRTLGFVLGGVGVAGLGVGAVTGLLVLGKKSTVDGACDARKVCTPAGIDAASSGHTLQIVSNVGWIAGIAGLGAGAYLLLTSRRDEPTTRASLAPIPLGARVSVERSF